MTTLAQLQRYFDAVGASPECPICHAPNKQWKVETRPEGATLLTHEQHVIWHDGAVRVICLNCGFIRLHEQQDIENWSPRDAD